MPCGGWRPPGLRCPWPEDEYLCDGGDELPSVEVRPDWSVDGLELEDTVVHYDTLDGDTSSISALLADKGTDGFISLREAIIATNNTTNAARQYLPSENGSFQPLGGVILCVAK